MSLQPLQRFFFERAKISDWQTEGNQCQVPIGGEDVGEGVSYKMMLRGWLFKRVKTLEICVIHTALHGEERLVSGIESFGECRIESIRTDDDTCSCFAHPVRFTPADACYASILPDQLLDICVQPNLDHRFALYALKENPI